MRTLEGSRMFPVVAWATFIAFAALTVYLALELHETAAFLEQKTYENVTAVSGIRINH